MRYGSMWGPYVPVAKKRANARKFASQRAKKQKRDCQPIEIQGNMIAKSFWGQAWCDHLIAFSDYANRLPRGATYVRNGSVVDLVIKPGTVNAIVAGSEPYTVKITIQKLKSQTWTQIKKDCSASIDSLIDLLGGRLSDGVMKRLTDNKSGCFPSNREIAMTCSCPDWSGCCKHIAAVMYGVGSRLDVEPELLFLLRGVDQNELVSQAVSQENLDRELAAGSNSLAGTDLGEMFGIELDNDAVSGLPAKSRTAGNVSKRKKASQKRIAKTVKKTTSKPAAARKPKTVKKKITKKKVSTQAVKKRAASKAKLKSAKAKTRATTKKNAKPKNGTSKNGTSKIGTSKVSTSKVAKSKVSTSKVSTSKVGKKTVAKKAAVKKKSPRKSSTKTVKRKSGVEAKTSTAKPKEEAMRRAA